MPWQIKSRCFIYPENFPPPPFCNLLIAYMFTINDSCHFTELKSKLVHNFSKNMCLLSILILSSHQNLDITDSGHIRFVTETSYTHLTFPWRATRPAFSYFLHIYHIPWRAIWPTLPIIPYFIVPIIVQEKIYGVILLSNFFQSLLPRFLVSRAPYCQTFSFCHHFKCCWPIIWIIWPPAGHTDGST